MSNLNFNKLNYFIQIEQKEEEEHKDDTHKSNQAELNKSEPKKETKTMRNTSEEYDLKIQMLDKQIQHVKNTTSLLKDKMHIKVLEYKNKYNVKEDENCTYNKLNEEGKIDGSKLQHIESLNYEHKKEADSVFNTQDESNLQFRMHDKYVQTTGREEFVDNEFAEWRSIDSRGEAYDKNSKSKLTKELEKSQKNDLRPSNQKNINKITNETQKKVDEEGGGDTQKQEQIQNKLYEEGKKDSSKLHQTKSLNSEPKKVVESVLDLSYEYSL